VYIQGGIPRCTYREVYPGCTKVGYTQGVLRCDIPRVYIGCTYPGWYREVYPGWVREVYPGWIREVYPGVLERDPEAQRGLPASLCYIRLGNEARRAQPPFVINVS